MSNVFYCIRDKSVYSGMGKTEEVWGCSAPGTEVRLALCRHFSVARGEYFFLLRGKSIMVSSDSKKLHIFRQQACNVSRALWPADVRRSLATGRVAQQRRSLLLKGKRWESLVRLLQIDTAQLLFVVALFVGSTILAALLLHLWYVLLIPIFMLGGLTGLLVLPWLSRLYQRLRSVARRTPRVRGSHSSFPTMQSAPETPLPADPLVRILETYDLSQTDVEHFVDTAKRERLGIF